MKKAIIYIKNNFEEIEALATVDVLRRGGIDTTLVACEPTLTVKGSKNIIVVADQLFADITDFTLFDIHIVPGGLHVLKLVEDKQVISVIQQAFQAKKILAAICAGPLLLAVANVIKDRTFTCFPTVKDQMPSQANFLMQRVVVHPLLVTSQGPGTTIEFALEILSLVIDQCLVKKITEGLIA